MGGQAEGVALAASITSVSLSKRKSGATGPRVGQIVDSKTGPRHDVWRRSEGAPFLRLHCNGPLDLFDWLGIDECADLGISAGPSNAQRGKYREKLSCATAIVGLRRESTPMSPDEITKEISDPRTILP
jgi:hypothetical protein